MAKVEYAKGLEGVIAAESKICKIDGENGVLHYMGYSIEDLVKNTTYEEVTYLLLYGELPTKDQLDGFSEKMSEEKALALGFAAFLHKPFSINELATEIQRVLKLSGVERL